VVAVRHIVFICLLSLLFAIPASAYQQMEFVREIGEMGGQVKQRQFNAPRALAAFGDRLYAADTDGHRVVVLDQNGNTVLTWGSKGSKPGQFRSPAGIAIDEQGRVYIADTGNSRVQVFDGEGKWLRSFGAKGDGPREFNSPIGIAVSKGLVYIADTGNSRVQVLTVDGIFMTQISEKVAKSDMKSPVGVAVDVQNRVYVLDAGKNMVRVFDPSGTQVVAFGSRGISMAGFDKPQGVAVDVRGNIYVADTGNFKVKKFDGQGNLVCSSGSAGDGHGQFYVAAGLTVDPEGKIWVVDAGKSTVQVFVAERDDAPMLTPASPLPTMEFLKEMPGGAVAITFNNRAWGILGDSLSTLGVDDVRTIGSRGSKPAFFKNPRGIAVDGQGNFWVADTGNDRLQKFSRDGNLLHVIGKSGSGEGEFHSPSGIAVSPKGNLCIADTGNKRVQVFNARGAFIGSFGKKGKLAGQINEIVDIAVDGAENLYVVDRGNDRIAKYDSDGRLLWEAGKTGTQDAEFREPENIVVSPDNEVYVLDAGNARIQVFDGSGRFLRKFGSEGTVSGKFRAPLGLALEEGRWLYVGDRGNNRVQVFLLRHTPAVPIELSAQARANLVQVSWKGNMETYLEQYKIYRADSPTAEFTLVGTSTTPFYLDKNLQTNRSFHYRVSSQAQEGNESALSDFVSAVTPKLVPGVPKRIRVEAQVKQITISWLPNLEPFINRYRVYRTKQVSAGFELLIETDKTIITDGPIEDETIYYYQITAVGKEGDESPASQVVFASTPRAPLVVPPLAITRIEADEIFASVYQYYGSHTLGKVVIANNTDRAYQKVKLSLMVKDYMYSPMETVIAEIGAKQQIEVLLKPLFNNLVLDDTDNTPLRGEVAVSVYEGGEPRTVKRSFPLVLFERHAMRWDRKAKLGAFVTHKAPVVADFSRLVVQEYIDAYPNVPQSIVYARGIYDALGVLGLKYLVDPTSPFMEFSNSASAVDYLQFPRDTLSRKSGDCDDLSVLFAACMENIGIGTAFVKVPGHLFVMFNTGVLEKDRITLGFPDELLVLHQGMVWIPVEMTMVGASFTRAWQKGAEEYRDWSARKSVDIISVQKAWEEFMPVLLPKTDLRVKVKRDVIEAAYKDELETLGRQRLMNLSAGYREMLKKNPYDKNALAQLGILFAENGLTSEALEQFQKMLAHDKTNALALNNIGNISYLQSRFDDARLAYEAALKASSGEPGIMVNLARTLLQTGKKEDAKKLFQDAAAIDPRVLRQYADLAVSLEIVK